MVKMREREKPASGNGNSVAQYLVKKSERQDLFNR